MTSNVFKKNLYSFALIIFSPLVFSGSYTSTTSTFTIETYGENYGSRLFIFASASIAPSSGLVDCDFADNQKFKIDKSLTNSDVDRMLAIALAAKLTGNSIKFKVNNDCNNEAYFTFYDISMP